MPVPTTATEFITALCKSAKYEIQPTHLYIPHLSELKALRRFSSRSSTRFGKSNSRVSKIKEGSIDKSLINPTASSKTLSGSEKAPGFIFFSSGLKVGAEALSEGLLKYLVCFKDQVAPLFDT